LNKFIVNKEDIAKKLSTGTFNTSYFTGTSNMEPSIHNKCPMYDPSREPSIATYVPGMIHDENPQYHIGAGIGDPS